MLKEFNPALLVFAAIIALGPLAAGFAIGNGLKSFRQNERYVEVKGLAERAVKADLAVWNLRFVTTGNDLPLAQAKIEQDGKALLDFMKQQGFTDDELALQRLDVVDLLAQAYRPDKADQGRYILGRTLTIRTNKVDLVDKTSSLTGELVKKGVIFDGSSGFSNTPYYFFTKLNEIKPEMIAEATKNAREAGQQFAKDSGADLGNIRYASQGYFSILPGSQTPGAEEGVQINKLIRIVTTVNYALKN
jgi:uncharacterized protein